MRLDKFLMAFVVFSLIVVTGTLIIGNINTNYSDVGVNMSTDDFNDTYNTIDQMYNISQDMKNQTYGGDIEDGDALDSAISGSYSAIRMVRNTFKLIGDIINDVAEVVGVPAYFITFAMTALTILIVFALIYLILRFRPF